METLGIRSDKFNVERIRTYIIHFSTKQYTTTIIATAAAAAATTTTTTTIVYLWELW
jgi:aspartate 1-decarboxylase